MNRRLLILNGIAIVAVVANHASHAGFIAMIWWTDLYRNVTVPNYDQIGTLPYYGLVAEQKLALFSVPAFLFVSGIFIAYAVRGGHSRLNWGMIKKRTLNLLPPYIIWTAVFVLLDIGLAKTTYTPSEIALSFVTLRHSPFFFIPLLIVFLFLSPLLAPIAKKHPKLLLGISIAFHIAAITYSYIRVISPEHKSTTLNLLLSNQITEYIFYYIAGLTIGLRFSAFKKNVYKLRWVLLVITILFGILAVLEAEWIFQQYGNERWRSITLSVPTFLYAISFVCCFLAFEHVNPPFSKIFYNLGVSTLGIYLVHQPVLLIFPKVIYHVCPAIFEYQLWYQLLLIIVAIAIPVAMMKYTKRSPAKKYYRILFG